MLWSEQYGEPVWSESGTNLASIRTCTAVIYDKLTHIILLIPFPCCCTRSSNTSWKPPNNVHNFPLFWLFYVLLLMRFIDLIETELAVFYCKIYDWDYFTRSNIANNAYFIRVTFIVIKLITHSKPLIRFAILWNIIRVNQCNLSVSLKLEYKNNYGKCFKPP